MQNKVLRDDALLDGNQTANGPRPLSALQHHCTALLPEAAVISAAFAANAFMVRTAAYQAFLRD